MATVLRDPGSALRALRRLVEWAEEIRFAYAWISSGDGEGEHWAALDLGKLTKAVVGIHFAQTEPTALRTLAALGGPLKVVDDTAGVFHPKVIVGLRAAEAKAIVGSSNFTTGGFAGNTELNILLRGDRTKKPLSDIIDFIDDVWSGARAFSPDEDWLDRYEQAHRRRPKPPRVPPASTPTVITVAAADDLDLAWPDYYRLIAAQERRALANGHEIHVFDHPGGSYLQEIDACRAAFDGVVRLEDVPTEERKLIGGWGGGSSGYFGNMQGAGRFKNLMLQRPAELGEHLDRVPFNGPVKRTVVEEYLDGVMDLEGVSLATATRLLTVKRPDLFLPVNNANKVQLRSILGATPASAGAYLDLLDRLWSLPWFKAPLPDGRDEQRVWRGRVGLLDSLLYEIPDYLM